MAAEPMNGQQSMSMWMVVSSLKKRWPRVPHVTTSTLCEWMSGALDSNATGLVLLDCRPEEEYKVSHIDGSLRVDPSLSDLSATLQHIQSVADDKNEVNVVCYCSVGYRSCKYAEAIQTELTKSETDERLATKLKTYNLEGSLFQWANEGRPMVDYVNHSTKYAHPYNIIWGKLLNKDLRRSDTKY